MKTRLSLLLAVTLCVSTQLRADDPLPIRPPEQLDELYGPIALYPDALIALILPASTFPADIVLAARYLDSSGDPARAEDQPWDDSVRALAHYPDVIKWMDQNLAWTRQAGDAFAAQPADVMNSIQRLRVRARAAGSLTDTPQQQVMMEDDNIRIIPAQPDVIYVPVYDPDIVYVSRPGYYSDPFLTFGVGYATGFWLGYDFDWGHRRIWSVDRRYRERYWQDHHDWHRPSFPDRPGRDDRDYHRQPWSPRPNYSRPSYSTTNRQRPEVTRPGTLSNGQPSPRSDRSRDGNGRPDAGPRDNDHRRAPDDRGASPSRRPERTPPPAETRAVAPTPATVSNAQVSTVTAPPPQYRRDRDGGSQSSQQRERAPASAPSAPPQYRGSPSAPPPAAQPPAPPRAQVSPPQPQARTQSATPPGTASGGRSAVAGRSPPSNRTERSERSERRRQE